MDDFDWTTDMYYPTIDLTEKLSLLGNFYTSNMTEKRTIITFRMYADYETLIKKSFDETLAFFKTYTNDF